jgi:hypothetical protein
MRQTDPRLLSYCGPAGKLPRSIARRLTSAIRVLAGDNASDRPTRVHSSTIGPIVIGHPAVVTSKWKFAAQIRSGASEITIGGAGWIRGIRAAGAATPKPSVARKVLPLLVIDRPAFCMSVVMRPVADAPWRSSAAGSQRHVRIARVAATGSGRRVAGGAPKVRVAMPAPRIFRTTAVGYAAAETALEGLRLRRYRQPFDSKHYRRWKICRTQGKRPISRGEYSPSRREQLGRQRLYPSVTI